ncbi:MAG: ABC transporter ATP-binding protein [Tissierellia bacterium]|nr:ABC transporter ATP-binding protein [Tissierellia bacterium]
MKNHLINKYALTEEGAKNMIKAIKWSVLVELSYLFPASLSIYILRELISILYSDSNKVISYALVIFSAIIIVIIMFLMERKRYDLVYTKTYEESAKNRIDIAERLRKLPLAYFGKRDLADLTSTIMNDITELEVVYANAIPGIYSSFFSIAIIMTLTAIYNWKMTLAIVWLIPLAFLHYALTRKKMKLNFKKTHKAKLKVTSYFQEGLDNITEIKAYNNEKEYSNDLNKLLDEYERILVKEETVTGARIGIIQSIFELCIVSVVIIGAVLLFKNQIDLFTYLIFIIFASRIHIKLTKSVGDMVFMIYADIRIKRLKEIQDMPMQEGKKDFSPNGYDLQFENVKFSYDEEIEVLNNISFEAKQNEVTALVGPSGGGKSTTAKLAARFWDIQDGKITLGGEDISKVDPEILLKYYSIVFQDVKLFNFSVLENIRIGRKDASDEEVLRVAKLAQCDDIASKLTDGYHTLIGENGERLSGGQRQRISIARAMLKDAPIIILDEATASIDAENESKIQKALSELVKDKTVLVIGHRMRTIRNADKVIVIKDGKIAEMGSPDELIKSDGIFAGMNKLQIN